MVCSIATSVMPAVCSVKIRTALATCGSSTPALRRTSLCTKRSANCCCSPVCGSGEHYRAQKLVPQGEPVGNVPLIIEDPDDRAKKRGALPDKVPDFGVRHGRPFGRRSSSDSWLTSRTRRRPIDDEAHRSGLSPPARRSPSPSKDRAGAMSAREPPISFSAGPVTSWSPGGCSSSPRICQNRS